MSDVHEIYAETDHHNGATALMNVLQYYFDFEPGASREDYVRQIEDSSGRVVLFAKAEACVRLRSVLNNARLPYRKWRIVNRSLSELEAEAKMRAPGYVKGLEDRIAELERRLAGTQTVDCVTPLPTGRKTV